MQFKKFLLSLTDDGMQEAELNRFLRGRRIVKVEREYVSEDKLWAFLVSYLDGEQERTRRRFRTRLGMMQLAFREGRLDEEAYHCRLAALHAHVSHADSAAYVRRVLAGQGHLP